MKAYAEIETDTPGQIFGITPKSDGKSNTPPNGKENVSAGFTQGAKEDSQYEAHDTSATKDAFAEAEASEKSFFAHGVILVGILLVALMVVTRREAQEHRRIEAMEYASREREREMRIASENITIERL